MALGQGLKANSGEAESSKTARELGPHSYNHKELNSSSNTLNELRRELHATDETVPFQHSDSEIIRRRPTEAHKDF